MPTFDRRNFLKTSGVSILPALVPFTSIFAKQNSETKFPPLSKSNIKFYGDGEIFSPTDYLDVLQKANALQPIVADNYGVGGAIDELQKKFAAITGKEKAIYLPTGTMANQLAISLLSGDNTKIVVQETSHVYRDEGDASQSVFGKRLIPLAQGQPYFTLEDLRQMIDLMPENEVFQSNIGAVSIENPIRRADGRTVPIDEIKKISAYCKTNKIKLHLDGARIFIASAWTGISIKEYASYFDTIYISLYKYLGAGGGAILCGDKSVIDRIPHLIKVHGGNMFSNWANAAMAFHRLEGVEERFQEVVKRASIIFPAISKIPGIKINSIAGGTNIYTITITKEIDGKLLRDKLINKYGITLPRPYANVPIKFSVNESLLYEQPDYVINAFAKSV